MKNKLFSLYIILVLIFLFSIMIFSYEIFFEYKVYFSAVFICALVYLLVQQLLNIEDTKKIINMTKKIDMYLNDKPQQLFHEKLHDRNLHNFISLTYQTISYLHHKIENKKKFNANLAHEIRKPLTAMRNSIEINFLNKEMDFANDVLRKVKEIEDITRQLLLLSDGDSENLKKSMTRAFFHEVLQKAIESKKEYARQKNIQIHSYIDNIISMHANSVLLKFAIANLIDNAIKYSKPNSLIKVILRKKREYVYCIIKDYGYGISKGDKKFIIQPFYRGNVDNLENIEGFGIGLALAHSILKIHHISFKIRSFPNKGTLILLKIRF